MAKEESALLESWKEISAYLKRSERTCRRWEITLGLPVHRLDGTPSARVFAYPGELDRWLNEKLHKLDEEARTVTRRSRKRVTGLAAAAGTVIVLGAAAAAFVLPSRLPPVPPGRPTLAIVPFESAGGEAGLEPWRTAFPDLLVTCLRQSRYVGVLGINDLARRLRGAKLEGLEKFTDEDLGKVGEAAPAGFVVSGTIGRDGQETVVAVSVRRTADGQPAGSFRAGVVDEQGLFAAADELAEDIRRAVGLTPRYLARDLVKKTERVTTSSPEAFELFSRGFRLFGAGKPLEAIPILQKAVEIDPDFALAYKYLYRSSSNAMRPEDEKRYALRAMALAGRLPERERGELLWLYHDNFEKDEAKKMRALERLCRFYPDDRFGSVNLLESYTSMEEWTKALKAAERAWAVNKADFPICGMLAQCYENLGQGDTAEKALTEYIDRNPGGQYSTNALSLRARCRLRLGKFDAALGDVDLLNSRSRDPLGFLLMKGNIELYQHDFQGAERDYRRVLGHDDPLMRIEAQMSLRDLHLMRGRVEDAKRDLLAALEMAGRIEGQERQVLMKTVPIHMELAYLHSLTGHYPEALKEVEAALQDYLKAPTGDSGPPLNLMRQKALINLDLGRVEEFDSAAEEIRARVERGENPRRMRDYYLLRGYRELKNSNFQAAFDLFQRSLDLVSVPGLGFGADPEYFYPLAAAYMKYHSSGGRPGALAVLERIVLPTVNRLHCGDIYARSLFEIAKFYDDISSSRSTKDESRAYRLKAIENYRKFLGLWEDADPIFQADVEAARSRLAALEAE